MSTLTTNQILSDFVTTGIQVPFGDKPLLRKDVDPAVIRKALDNYCATSYAQDWDAFFDNYALNKSIYAQNNGNFKVSVGREQIHTDMLANILLLPGFASYPYYVYAIHWNYAFLLLDNVFPGVISGNSYDFPNCIFLAFNKKGKVIMEVDTYSNGTAIFNAIQWAQELGGVIPPYGRPPGLVPMPQPVDFSKKYPLLHNIDQYWPVLTPNMLLLTVSKVSLTPPGGEVPFLEVEANKCRVLRWANRFLKAGYVKKDYYKFFRMYAEDAILVEDYQLYAIGRQQIEANFNVLLAQVPNIQYRFNYYFLRHNCLIVGLQLDFFSKLNHRYTAPITLLVYFRENGEIGFQQNLANYENIQAQVDLYLADQAQP